MKTAYVILGMHRSGTSSVAGSLAMLGAQPPATLMGPKDDNPSGFWESEKITDFNDHFFGLAGSSWRDWGPFNPEMFSGKYGEHFEGASRWLIEAEFGGADTIVLKDPRICRIYPQWRATLLHMGYSPIVVSPIRAPGEVVASLAARNAMPRSLAMRLWLSHVLEAEEASRGDPRHILLWPDFITSWRDHVRKIMALGGPLHLTGDAENRVDEFLNADLRRQKAETSVSDLPDLLVRTMGAMEQLAHQNETATALKTLDTIRSDFAKARQLYYDGPC